ncbi:hypothetical protein M2419_002268 [Sphingobacterium sp. BIGb0116]|nr:hypothetical protein [Sphingobacterium sp. BIGb0116]
MPVNRLLKSAFALLLLSITIVSYCVHLKLCHKGKNIHENKGVLPKMPIWDISNFAHPYYSDVHTQKIEYDTSKNYNKKSLKRNG